MNEFLKYKILDNTVEAYLYVLGVIVLALIFKRFISKYLAGVLCKLVTKAGKSLRRQSFIELVVAPLETFLLLLVVIISFDKLKYPKAWDVPIYKITLHQLIESFAAATLIVAFIWLCLRIIEFIALILAERANLTKDQADNQLIVFFKDFFKVLLVIVGFLLLLKFAFNQKIGNLLTGLSLVGAAVALATRESLENLIASFIIFFDKPFVTGDTVKVHNFTGTIEKIGLRSTRIRTVDKTYISVPNKQMVDSIVDNISLRTQRKAELRLELKLSVTTSDLKQFISDVKKVLLKEHIVKSTVYFSETGKNANVVQVEYFTDMAISDDDFNELKQQVNLEIMSLVEQSGIDFATLEIQSIFQQPKNTN